MTYKTFINNIHLTSKENYIFPKKKFGKEIKKKDIVSIGFHDYEKEEIRLEQFDGRCLKFKSNNLNSKLTLHSKFRRSDIQFNFFLYSPHLFDIFKHSIYKKSLDLKEERHPDFVNWKIIQERYWRHRRCGGFYWYPNAALDWFEDEEKIWTPMPELPQDISWEKKRKELKFNLFYHKNKLWRKKKLKK